MLERFGNSKLTRLLLTSIRLCPNINQMQMTIVRILIVPFPMYSNEQNWYNIGNYTRMLLKLTIRCVKNDPFTLLAWILSFVLIRLLKRTLHICQRYPYSRFSDPAEDHWERHSDRPSQVLESSSDMVSPSIHPRDCRRTLRYIPLLRSSEGIKVWKREKDGVFKGMETDLTGCSWTERITWKKNLLNVCSSKFRMYNTRRLMTHLTYRDSGDLNPLFDFT